MKKQLFFLALGVFFIFSLGFASASYSGLYSGSYGSYGVKYSPYDDPNYRISFKDSSYISPSALPHRSVFYTPDNTYRSYYGYRVDKTITYRYVAVKAKPVYGYDMPVKGYRYHW